MSMNNINELTAKLKAAAQKATPGRIGDRIDGSGSIKYQCVGYDGSLVLQVDHKNMEYGFIGDNADADEEFFRACVPDAILALTEALEAAEKVSASRLEAIDRAHKMFQRERDRAEAAEKRIAELEARTLIVKLPEPKNSICSDWNGGFESAMQLAHDRIKLACAVAGIKLQIEGE